MDPQARGLAAKALKLVRPSLTGRSLRVVPFGDSITAGSSVFTGGLWQYASNYAETSLYLAGRRFTLANNAGVAGNTTADMLARIQSDVLAYSPDVCLLLGGTNDLTSGMANSAFTTMFQNLETMVRMLLAQKCLPVIVTCPPKNSAAPESRKAQVFYYLLAKAYGLPLIDSYRVLVDPSTGNYNASYSGDGTHPNTAGITAIAAVAGPILATLDTAYTGPYLAAYSETTAGNFANLFRNGNFARAASTPTPDGWVLNNTNATQTLETPSAPYNGNTFKYVKASGAAVFPLTGGATVNVGSGLAVGDTLVMSGRIKSSGRTSPVGFQLGLDRSPSGNFRPMSTWLQDGDFVFSAELVVPTSTTAFTVSLYVNDVGTYEVNNLTLWNKTAAQAIWTPNP